MVLIQAKRNFIANPLELCIFSIKPLILRMSLLSIITLLWRHNDRGGVSNHQPRDCFLNRLFRRGSKKIKTPRHWPLFGEVTGDQWLPRTNGQKPQNWPVLRCDHNLTSSEGVQDTSACKMSDHSIHALSGKCLETSWAGGRTDGQTDGRTCRKRVTVGRMDQQFHVHVGKGYFRLRADGRTDGQTTRNIMPQTPKGGGIKIIALKVSDSSNKWDFYPVLYALWEMCICLLHKLACMMYW